MAGKAKMPKTLPPARMPAQGDEASKLAKRRAQNQLQGQRGREATDLSMDSDNDMTVLGR
jgi:hypothetical protein